MKPVVVTFVLCVLMYYCAPSVAYDFDNCGSTGGKFTSVEINECPQTYDKCYLPRGSNASISIKFIPNEDLKQLYVRVYGQIIDVDVPFPFDKSNVCDDPDSGIHCPLKKDEKYTYNTTINVKTTYPKVNLNIKWEFLDEKKNDVICILFPAKVK